MITRLYVLTYKIGKLYDDHKGKRLCRGAVFSYYKFKHPLSDRLTDEQWQQMLIEGKESLLPQWTNEFITE